MSSKKAYVLVMATIVMIAISFYSLTLLTKAQSYSSLLYNSLGKEVEKHRERIDSISLLNVALSVMTQRRSELIFHSVKHSQDLKEFLDGWIEKAQSIPGEGDMWYSVYQNISSDGYGAVMEDVNAYSNLVSALVSNGVLSSDVQSDCQVRVYRFFLPPDLNYLLVVKCNRNYLWATASSKALNQYIYVTNKETDEKGYPIYFISGDVIDGPVYTTDTINISGDPVFKGSVTAAGLNMTENSNPTFENGFNQLTGEPEFVLDEDFANSVMNDYSVEVKRISDIENGDVTGVYLPRSGPGNFASDARVDGVYIDENTAKLIIYRWQGWWREEYEIIYDSTPLNEDGTMNATLVDLDTGDEIAFKFNGIVLSQVDLYVSSPDAPSFFSGLLTLASEDDIYIRGSIVYSHLRTGSGSFRTDTSSYNELSEGIELNKLNLVAYDNVIMRYYVPDNLYITASIFALTGKFTLEYYWWVEKDTLHIFGSIVQKSRGIIGLFYRDSQGNVHKVTGFFKDYMYDRRLYAPPYPYKTPIMEGRMSVLDFR